MQYLYNFPVVLFAPLTRLVQRRFALLVHQVRIGTVAQQDFDEIGATKAGGIVERGGALPLIQRPSLPSTRPSLRYQTPPPSSTKSDTHR